MGPVMDDLAQRLWCAVKRCSCSKAQLAAIPGGWNITTVQACQCCADDTANLTELGYVTPEGEWAG